MSATCKHASGGCDYPAGECSGACTMAGGPAFPRQHTVADANHPAFKLGNEGMSLRDYFAAKTLPACIAVATEAMASSRATLSNQQAADFRRAICIDAWGWADEMLAARGAQS